LSRKPIPIARSSWTMLASEQVNSISSNSRAATDGRSAFEWLYSTAAEVWLKFLLALLGLGLAFAAALFSSASREAGNLWASVVLASLSLLLAAFVGLVTVPYLARRVAFERLRETLDYEVTKVGVIYVLVTLVIGIAALNTANNLLYIVVAAMLAAILVSGVVSAWVLRGLELEVSLPEHVFAGQPVVGRVVLHNRRRFLPSFSIRVLAVRRKKKIRKHWRWEPTTFAFPSNRAPENQWLRMRDWRVVRVRSASPGAGIFDGMVYFPYLPPRARLQAELELRFERRGRYCESSFGVATRFPFAFLTKSRRIALQRETVVYPPVEPADEFFEILPLVRGEWESFVRGRGSDLYRIREYMPEDSARHVDWKATAKSGSLKVREFSREDERKLCIVFDNPAAGLISARAYERAVNLAASLAWHFSLQHTELSFVIPGQDRCSDLYDFLAKLAVIEPRTEAKITPAKHGSDAFAEMSVESIGEYKIILTARCPESMPSGLSNSSYFVYFGQENASQS
jgi:uncharacterized protein (DUF58 family)